MAKKNNVIDASKRFGKKRKEEHQEGIPEPIRVYGNQYRNELYSGWMVRFLVFVFIVSMIYFVFC